MWVDEAERFVVDNVSEVFQDLYIADMTISVVLEGQGMGPNECYIHFLVK
ncbi:MAG: hypothetical protein SVE93_07600 [Candidatus Thermoplasmatota archaeon]|nr:hypothetical protein [Candidatus Thermoplasmatota archaeon]